MTRPPDDDYPPNALETMAVRSSCDTCARRTVGTLGCEAFEVIPLEIIRGKNPHTSPYPGDHGLMYLPIDARARK